MKELESITIEPSTLPALVITCVFLFLIPLAFFIYWRTKHRQLTNIRYLLAGILGFFITVRVLELGVHYFCIISSNPVSQFITTHTWAYVLYGTTMAGVFEECGRHIILKYIMKKDRTRENAVLYGIGHGGIENWGVMLPAMITEAVIAYLFLTGGSDDAVKTLGITETTAASALATIQSVAAFGYAAAFLTILERLVTMFVHIGLSVIVYHGIVSKKRSCLPLAIVLHMITDVFAALYQQGAVALWAAEIWLVCWTAAIMWLALKSYRILRQSSEESGIS